MSETTNKLLFGDCLELMPTLEPASIDLILCDLPYGTTACAWDTIIPLDQLWKEYRRLIKPGGVIVLTASQPFTTALITSNPEMFKYELIWDKGRGYDPQLANIRPMKAHENICVFYEKSHLYNPQMIPLDQPRTIRRNVPLNKQNGEGQKLFNSKPQTKTYTHSYPTSVLYFMRDPESLHPTQKPVALMEYLIRTYTNEGETVLDNCFGSGTTGVACVNTRRNFVGIEQNETYFQQGAARIEHAEAKRDNRTGLFG